MAHMKYIDEEDQDDTHRNHNSLRRSLIPCNVRVSHAVPEAIPLETRPSPRFRSQPQDSAYHTSRAFTVVLTIRLGFPRILQRACPGRRCRLWILSRTCSLLVVAYDLANGVFPPDGKEANVHSHHPNSRLLSPFRIVCITTGNTLHLNSIHTKS